MSDSNTRGSGVAIVSSTYLLCLYVHILAQPSFTGLTNSVDFDKIKIILTSFLQKQLHQLGSNYVEMVFNPTFSDSSVCPCLRRQHQQWPCNNISIIFGQVFDFSNNIFIDSISALYVGVSIQMMTVTHRNAPR